MFERSVSLTNDISKPCRREHWERRYSKHSILIIFHENVIENKSIFRKTKHILIPFFNFSLFGVQLATHIFYGNQKHLWTLFARLFVVAIICLQLNNKLKYKHTCIYILERGVWGERLKESFKIFLMP